MNVERTMGFILEQQAQTAVQLQQITAHQARQDRRVDGIAKLSQIGMKMLVRQDKEGKARDRAIRELAGAQKSLAEAQKRTEQRFERFIRGLERGSGNGG